MDDCIEYYNSSHDSQLYRICRWQRIVAATYEPYKSPMRSASHSSCLQTFIKVPVKELSTSMHTQGVRLSPTHKAFGQGLKKKSSIRVSGVASDARPANWTVTMMNCGRVFSCRSAVAWVGLHALSPQSKQVRCFAASSKAMRKFQVWAGALFQEIVTIRHQ